MKPSSIAITTAICALCFSLWSCNPQNPSAAKENEKALAEATSKVSKLEEEIANLKLENETLTQKASSSESKGNGLTEAQLDTKLNPLTEQLATITKKLDSVIAQNDARNKEAQPTANTDPQTVAPPPKETTPKQTTTTPAKSKEGYDIKFDEAIMGPGSHK